MVDLALREKISESERVLRLAVKMSQEYYGKPLIVCYSGGKDSDVMLHIVKECLNRDEFIVQHSHTTVDAPPTVYHTQDVFSKCREQGITTEYKNRYPVENTMWGLIVKRQIPPTRTARYCCAVLKEASTPHSFIATGVRGGESAGRKNRGEFSVRGKTKKLGLHFSLEHVEEIFDEAHWGLGESFDCTFIQKAKEHKDLMCSPIYKWSYSDIWEYIRYAGIKVCELYKMGYERVGCIGCPLSGYRAMMREFRDFPTYKSAYINAFQKMVEARAAAGKTMSGRFDWSTGERVFSWWVNSPDIDGQMSLFELTTQ